MASKSGRGKMAGVSRGTFAGRLGEALERQARAKNKLGDLAGSLRELEASLQDGDPAVKELLKQVPSIGSPEVKAELAVPLRKFAEARTLLIGLSRAEVPAKKQRAEAHREYFETRNELLFRAVRIHQRRFSLFEDGTRGKEYQDLLDKLFTNFITDERYALSESIHAAADTAYSLAFDPELLREFKNQILHFYENDNLATTEERKALMESILVPDLRQLETPLTTAESRALREARLAYASSKIAAAEGAPHADARAIEKRYHELRADALMQIRKMKESTEEDNEWVEELTYKAQRADMQLEIALLAAKLSPEKQKRAGKLGARLSKMKWGRNTLALLAIFAAVSKDAPDVDVTPMHGGAPTEDVQTPRAQASAPDEQQSSVIPPTLFEGNRLVEEGQSITITIPENGNALSALREVVIASSRIPWVTAWMEKVHREARPDLVVTREGRLEALAMDAGFMTEYDELDSVTGAYVSRSAPIPPGSVLVLGQTGMRFRYPDGTEQLLVNGDTLESNPLATQ